MTHVQHAPSSALAAQQAALQRAAFAETTWQAYASRLSRLEHWLDGRPLTDDTLAQFLTCEHARGLAPATIALTVSAVSAAARESRVDDPAGPSTHKTLAGIRRAGRGRGRGQVGGLTWSQIDAAAQLASRTGPAGLRNAALLCTMSDGLLRASEVCAVEWGHIAFEEDGSGRLTIPYSKTDPHGRGAVVFLGAPTVDRLLAWGACSGRQGRVFRRMRRHGQVTGQVITPRSVRRIVQSMAKNAGITQRVSGHSPRVGAAQSLVGHGATLPEVQLAGRWRSARMVAHYARGQRAGRGAVARLRYGDANL